MVACWTEDPTGEYFKKHLARIPDYLWVAEDGMQVQVLINFECFIIFYGYYYPKIPWQSFGSQLWDTSLAIQALLASNLSDEIANVIMKGHDFIKKSQVFLPSAICIIVFYRVS